MKEKSLCYSKFTHTEFRETFCENSGIQKCVNTTIAPKQGNGSQLWYGHTQIQVLELAKISGFTGKQQHRLLVPGKLFHYHKVAFQCFFQACALPLPLQHYAAIY